MGTFLREVCLLAHKLDGGFILWRIKPGHGASKTATQRQPPPPSGFSPTAVCHQPQEATEARGREWDFMCTGLETSYGGTCDPAG